MNVVNVVLRRAEILALAGDLEHSPDCWWAGTIPVFYLRASDGTKWWDPECTEPYEKPPCTCGYFTTLDEARRKIRLLLPDADR